MLCAPIENKTIRGRIFFRSNISADGGDNARGSPSRVAYEFVARSWRARLLTGGRSPREICGVRAKRSRGRMI